MLDWTNNAILIASYASGRNYEQDLSGQSLNRKGQQAFWHGAKVTISIKNIT